MASHVGGIVLNTKAYIRLITVGVIVVSNWVGGPWFWLGLLLSGLVVAGMAGASHRPALPWAGGLALLMWGLVHAHVMEPLVGMSLAGTFGLFFLAIWMRGPGRPRREAPIPSPHILRRQAG